MRALSQQFGIALVPGNETGVFLPGVINRVEGRSRQFGEYPFKQSQCPVRISRVSADANAINVDRGRLRHMYKYLGAGRDARRHDADLAGACDNCLEFLIRQEPVACATYNRDYAKRLVEIRKEKGKLKEKRT